MRFQIQSETPNLERLAFASFVDFRFLVEDLAEVIGEQMHRIAEQ